MDGSDRTVIRNSDNRGRAKGHALGDQIEIFKPESDSRDCKTIMMLDINFPIRGQYIGY